MTSTRPEVGSKDQGSMVPSALELRLEASLDGLTSPDGAGAAAIEPCAFCGTPLAATDKRKRCRPLSKLGEFVTKNCRPTEVIYPHFARLKGDDRLPLCIPCVNWQRRCGIGQRKRCGGEKPYLLADHFVIFMLEPGRITIPDQRCVLRLLSALATQACARPLLALMPLPVQVMVGMIGDKSRQLTTLTLIDELVRVWWDYNGRTVFFAHNLTAKLVRRMIKEF
jgi:hypothetical protein